jgi:2-dehydropantoate 2-reductase
VERPSGATTAPAKVSATLPNSVDVLWIATKTYQLKTALQAVQSLPRCIVPLLNGVDHIEFLRAHFGRHRVLPATIAVEA